VISVLTSKNICEVSEKVLSASAKFAIQNQKKNMDTILIIVPDRFTLQAEKILTNHAPVLLNVRIVTFSMLFHLLQVPEKAPAILDKTTAVLYTWRAIQDVRNKLVYFNRSVDQYAFSEKMFNTINQLESSRADFQNLEKHATSTVTKSKMHDITLIQTRYKELCKGNIDGAGMLDWLIKNVSKSEIIKNAHVYLTGFEYLSVQREEVTRQIARTAKSFTAGLQETSELKRVIDELRFAM